MTSGTFMEEYGWLTLLSTNAALRNAYRSLSKSVRVPYKFLKADELKLAGFMEYLSILIAEKKSSRYSGHGIIILPGKERLGQVLLCDELLGEYFGLPTHLFASSAQKRSLLAHYVASLLLADALGFSGFSGDGKKTKKLALGIMHAASPENCRHFLHSRFIGNAGKIISAECGRISSDFRELGITELDLIYALEKKPTEPEKKELLLKNEIEEIDTLLWMIERKKSKPISGKKSLQISMQKNFLRKAIASLAKIHRRRQYWDDGKKFETQKASMHAALEALAASERPPTKNLMSLIERLQPFKEKILRTLI